MVNDTQFGDRVELLQRWTFVADQETLSLVQQGQVVGPGTFAKKLLELQAAWEHKGKTAAAAEAKELSRQLETLGEGSSKRVMDRRARLKALLVAYDTEMAAMDDMQAAGLGTTWESLCPFIVEGDVEACNATEMAGSSAAGALDSDDEKEGILVKRRPEENWKPATKEEIEELRRHDRQQQEEEEEEEEQQRADAEAHSSLEAARAQEWEDWAMFSELRPASTNPGPRKRVKAMVTMATSQGQTVATGIMEADVLQTEEVLLQFTLKESMLAENDQEKDMEEQREAPPTPSTVHISETQLEHHARHAQELQMQDVDLDTFMNSRERSAVYQQWMQGDLSDARVSGLWGKDVLELFRVTRTIEEDSQALNTQGRDNQETRPPPTRLQDERGSSSEPGMENLGPEERRTKRVREGAIAGTTGYVAPMDDANLNGEVQVEAIVEERDHAGTEMDVQEMDDLELVQLGASLQVAENGAHMVEADHNEEYVSFMQRDARVNFATALQDLLTSLEAMPGSKSARIAHFLKDMLRDQQRMALRLRSPVLRSRAEQLQALVSVFLEKEDQLQGDEQEWCLTRWQLLEPFLEGRVGGAEEDEGPAGPLPSSALPEEVEVIDSQNQTMEEGSGELHQRGLARVGRLGQG